MYSAVQVRNSYLVSTSQLFASYVPIKLSVTLILLVRETVHHKVILDYLRQIDYVYGSVVFLLVFLSARLSVSNITQKV